MAIVTAYDISSTVGVNMTFKRTDFIYATLDGTVSVNGNLSPDWTGQLTGKAHLSVDFPQWFVPNARLRKVNINVQAEVHSSKCRCEAIVTLSGEPSNFLLALFFWNVNARGTASAPESCRKLKWGIVPLITKAASELHLHTDFLGIIPIGFGLPGGGAFRGGPSLGQIFKNLQPLSFTVHFTTSP